MQHKRTIAIAAAVVAAAAAALPAAGFADQPLFRDHESFVDPPSPGDWCGAVNGTWSDSGTFTFRQDASGAFHATQVERSVFTADATGTSIEVRPVAEECPLDARARELTREELTTANA